ncbi:MAG: flagellar basal body P-ring formation chaperone FlgA [Proteobacteria bacterium]|nr:flagellar basal body P-ring formation chaperone FlgA [Pseudomonadota bacterium]
MSESVRTIIILVCLLLFGSAFEVSSNENVQKTKVLDDSSQLIPEAMFREAYSQFICSRLEKKKDDIILSRFTVSGDKPLPAGKVSLKLFNKGREEFAGYVRLIAIVSIDDIPKTEVKLSGWVDVFDSVVCASQNLNRGDVITAGDIHLERKNISRLNSDTLKDVDQAIGLMAKHDIKDNDCLKEWMLKRNPLVNKGDMVTILAEHGSIRITAPGRILEKGYMGDYIKVQNAMSKKSVYAKIINDSTVVVDF